MRVQSIPLILVVAAACSDTTGSSVMLETPSALSSVSLDGAIALMWSDNSYISNPDGFASYRVYSTSYNLDADVCGASWSVEGTTVAPEFVVGALANGVPRCFAVSAINTDGVETGRSPSRSDTPRPDARNVVLFARQVQDASSGFRFWDDLNGDGAVQDNELGLVRSGASPTVDFRVEQQPNSLVLRPTRFGTGVEFYSPSPAGPAPIEDLTSIDFAPDQTYRSADVQAMPGFGYVFEMSGGDGFSRFGAVRVTHVGTNMIIFDWAFQTDPGNPELRTARR